MPIPRDKAVFIPQQDTSSGVLDVLVDDTIAWGNKAFYTLMKNTEKRFEVKPKTFAPFDFAGLVLRKTTMPTLLIQPLTR